MTKEIGYSNDELIKGVYAKDSQIIKHIIAKSFPSVKQLVLSNSGNELDADEVFQEALVVLYRKVREENFKLSCSVATFLYSVAKNQWLQELKRKRPHEKIIDVTDIAITIDKDTLEEIEKNDRLRLFREKFEELGKDCKKVLRLYLMKIPLSEITRIMGYASEQVARNRRYKCKERLINNIRSTARYKELGYEINQNN